MGEFLIIFEQVYVIAGAWRGIYATDDEAEAEALAGYGGAIIEIEEAEYLEILKKKPITSGSYPDSRLNPNQASQQLPHGTVAEGDSKAESAPGDGFETADDLLTTAESVESPPETIEPADDDPSSEEPEEPEEPETPAAPAPPRKRARRRTAKKSSSTHPAQK